MTEYFQIGIISKPHGLHGEVNVFPTTDDPARFKKLKKVIMESGRDGRIELNVQSVKFFKKFVIVKFKEFNTIEDVVIEAIEVVVNGVYFIIIVEVEIKDNKGGNVDEVENNVKNRINNNS